MTTEPSYTLYPQQAMTADTFEGATASTSLTTAGFEARKAFDKITTDAANYWQSASTYNTATGVYVGGVTTIAQNASYSGEWLQIQLPVSIVLKRYTLYSRIGFVETRSPSTFWIFGSVNGTTWNLVDSRVNEQAITTSRVFTLPTNTASYTYYRLVTNLVGNADRTTLRNVIQLAEWELYGFQSSVTAVTYNYAGNAITLPVGENPPSEPMTSTEASGFVSWLKEETNERNQNPWSKSAAPRITKINYTAPGTTTLAYAGGVCLPDGRVVFVPHLAHYVAVFNPSTGILSFVGSIYTGGNKWWGGVLLPDGRVFCIPRSNASALIFNPSDNSTTTISAAAGSNKWYGGVLTPDGKVVMVPNSIDRIGVFDPITNTISYPLNIGGLGTPKYRGGCLLPSGRVFFVAQEAIEHAIYDPVANTLTPVGAVAGLNQFSGAVLLPDGRLLIIPFSNATTIPIYDEKTNTFTSAGGIFGSTKFESGCLLGDGRVLFAPHDKDEIYLYDYRTNQLQILNPPDTTADQYVGATLMQDGRVILIPSSAPYYTIVSGFPIPPPQMPTHPAFNKF